MPDNKFIGWVNLILAGLIVALLLSTVNYNVFASSGKVEDKSFEFVAYVYNYNENDDVDEIIIDSSKYFAPEYYPEYTSYREVDLSEVYPGLVEKNYYHEALNKKNFFKYCKVYVDDISVERVKNDEESPIAAYKAIVCFYLDLGKYSNYKSTPGYAIIYYNKNFKIVKLEEKF